MVSESYGSVCIDESEIIVLEFIECVWWVRDIVAPNMVIVGIVVFWTGELLEQFAISTQKFDIPR
jgi:hypothetical protein